MNVIIKVTGNLDENWSRWFENLEIKFDGEYTKFEGSVADQSELHGILNKIRNLNLKLVLVETENKKK